jgi:hypothetical protein
MVVAYRDVHPDTVWTSPASESVVADCLEANRPPAAKEPPMDPAATATCQPFARPN